MANKIIFVALLLAVSFVGCQKPAIPDSFNDPAAYQAFIEHPDHKLLAIREHRDIRFAAQYLPPDFIRWRNLELGKATSDSDKGISSYVFVLNVGPAADAKTGDVMTYGVSNLEEYAERMEKMNFRLHESIELRVGNHTWKPSLVHMENTYGLTQDRNIHLAFDAKENLDLKKMDEDLDLVFDDPVFGTGINHFRIPQEALHTLPSLDI